MNPSVHCRCAISALLKNVDSATRREGSRLYGAGMNAPGGTGAGMNAPGSGAGPIGGSGAGSNGGPNAGIIIIGDEILKGQTRDTNSHFMTLRLRGVGVRVSRISVIPDELDVIAEEVRKFAETYDHVVTSGGIGPTHDDLTFEGIALAFGHEVSHHPDLVSIIEKWAKSSDLSLPHFKMSRVSKQAVLKFGRDPETGKTTNFPVVCVNNVYAFPGVPNILESAFPLLERELFCSSSSSSSRGSNPTFHGREIYLGVHETSVAKILDAFNDRFSPKGVSLGSYPKMTHSYYKVKLTLESTDESAVNSAHSALLEDLPDAFVLPDFDPHPLTDMGSKLNAFIAKEGQTGFGAKLGQAVDVVEDCLRRYSTEQVCLAFNGGKDCTALLHLFAAVLDAANGKQQQQQQHQQQQKQQRPKGFKAIYIRKGNPFPEVEKFVGEMVKEFDLEMFTVGGSIKDGLKKIKDDHPELKAAIMGTRRTDPYSAHLTAFSPTDPDWPPFMRVNPILDWNYKDVWRFLRGLSLPYCSLYDRGYTSLGSADNTFPCPKLEFVDDFGRSAFHPAYKLQMDEEEREGRL